MMAQIDKKTWPVLPVFDFLREAGDIDPDDMYSAFNMGIGYILVVPEAEADPVMNSLAGLGEMSYRIGKIQPGERSVRLTD